MITSLYCRNCGTRLTVGKQICATCGTSQTGNTCSSVHTQPQGVSLFSTGTLPPSLLLNQRYRLIETVGSGGMGAVYSAQDTQLGDRLVALKEMSISQVGPQDVPMVVELFRREAHLLASLHHPYLPVIHEYFVENGRWYLVMSFIEGQNLEAILHVTAGKRLPVRDVVRIGIELCEVLDYLHTHEPPIIFRDLKPQNIMMTPKGHICLIDFGIARLFKPEKTNDTARFYSVGYAPPEQYGQAQTSPRSDIYSLGATLHQMLSGRNPSYQPFQFSPLQLVDPTIPVPLAALIMQMVEMDPQRRPAPVSVIKQQLMQLLIPGQSEPLRGTWESAPDISSRPGSFLLQEQSPSSSRVSPNSNTSVVRSQPTQPLPGKKSQQRSQAQSLARRSFLLGLLGGVVVAGGGVFALGYYLKDAGMAGLAGKTTPGSDMSWTNFQQIVGQASKTAPALVAASNGTLDLVFVANNEGNGLLYISSQDSGATWSSDNSVPEQTSKTAPALAVAPDGTLYLVFVANNKGNSLLYVSSQDNGATWSSDNPIPEQASKTAPALAVASGGTLHLVFVANNEGNSLLYISSQDNGATWGNYGPVSGQASKTAPALAVASDGTLHLAFVMDDDSNSLVHISSQDSGATWSNVSHIGRSSVLAPALAILNNRLYLAFVANDGSNQLYVVSSQDGIQWTSKQEIGRSSVLAPTLTVLNNRLYLAFVASDGSNQLSIISSQA